MFKKVLFRGAVLVGSFMATVKMLDKIEEVDKKRRAKVKSVKIKLKKKNEITEEELKEAFEKAHELADELEAGGMSVYHD